LRRELAMLSTAGALPLCKASRHRADADLEA